MQTSATLFGVRRPAGTQASGFDTSLADPPSQTHTGDADNNFLTGDAGNDYLYGLAGNDFLQGGLGADVMAGGVGDDTYYVDNVGDVVWEWGGQGTDIVYSTISYTLPAAVENLTLTGANAIVGTGNELNNIILGSGVNSTLYGLAGDDTLDGGVGDDILEGGIGNDRLKGGVGADNLAGGIGNDVLDGGRDADVMAGGVGDDTYYIDHGDDVVWEWGSQGTDTVFSVMSAFHLPEGFENLIMHVGSATSRPDGVSYVEFGSGGRGNSLDNRLVGNFADNWLHGAGGNDNLSGGDGRDTLRGGTGLDVMSGGAGADLFEFLTLEECSLSSGATADRVADFSRADGDRINLSMIDADALVAGNQAFAFIGNDAAFTRVAGQLRHTSAGYLEGDVNGDAVPDLYLAVNNMTAMQVSDLIL